MSLSVSQYKCHQLRVLRRNWNVTPVMRRDCGGRLSAAAPALLPEGILSNVDSPSWDGVNSRFFVFSQANEKCTLFIMGWWEKIKTEGETINGKINRELNLSPQETGFEPKQLGTQRNSDIYETLDLLLVRETFPPQSREKKVCDHLLYFTVVPACATRGGMLMLPSCAGHNVLPHVQVWKMCLKVAGGAVSFSSAYTHMFAIISLIWMLN